jgi:hypothetical protein
MSGEGLQLNVGTGGAELLVDEDTSTSIVAQVVKLGYSASGATPVQVSTSTPLPVQVENATVTIVESVPLQVSGDVADEAAFTRGTSDVLPVSFAVDATAPTLTAGKTAAPSLDTAGNLRVNVIAGNGLQVDASTFTRGTTTETPIGCVVDATAPTLTAGNVAAPSLDTAGNLRVNLAAGGIAPFTHGRYVTTGSTNANVIKAAAGVLGEFDAINTAAYAVYIHWYDTASAPTAGEGTVVKTTAVAAGASIAQSVAAGIQFTVGIAFTITKGIGDSDATATLAGDLYLNFAFT